MGGAFKFHLAWWDYSGYVFHLALLLVVCGFWEFFFLNVQIYEHRCVHCVITILMTAAPVVIFPSLISDVSDLCFLSFVFLSFSVWGVYLRVLFYFFLKEALLGFTGFPCCFPAFSVMDFSSLLFLSLFWFWNYFAIFFLVSLGRNLGYNIRTFLFALVSLWYRKPPYQPHFSADIFFSF